jgi:hypothetical protein
MGDYEEKSSVNIGTELVVGQPGTQDSFPNWCRGFSFLDSDKTGSEAHPGFYSIGAGGEVARE